jgi:hypothetical protein
MEFEEPSFSAVGGMCCGSLHDIARDIHCG